MKNFTRIAGIIALVSIIGLSFASCGGGPGGGGNIAVRVKAYDNGGVEQKRSLSMNRAVGGGRGGLLRAVTDTASFQPLDDIYANDSLGDPISTYTPTQFNVEYSIDAILSDGSVVTVAEQQHFDFIKGLTVDVGDIPSGYTVVGLRIGFATAAENPVSFPYNGGTTVNAQFLGSRVKKGEGHNPLLWFVCYGDTRKYVKDGESFWGPDEEFPLNPGTQACIVIPFEEIVLSNSTSSVTLNISWNLQNIVGVYDPNAYAIDKYRFTKGWWNNLYVYASAN